MNECRPRQLLPWAGVTTADPVLVMPLSNTTMDPNNLYWVSFKALYQRLQAANRSSITELKEQLNLNFQWLLNGLDKFTGPSDESLSALKAGKSLKASAWGSGRGIAIDKQLINATIELSQLLVGSFGYWLFTKRSFCKCSVRACSSRPYCLQTARQKHHSSWYPLNTAYSSCPTAHL